jgi:hypothetical protein
MRTISGQCRLCLQQGELQDSHIVSKFIWRNAKATVEHGNAKVSAINNPSFEVEVGDGFSEYMLCSVCEGKLSAWESYSARALYSKLSPVQTLPPRHHIWTGLQYAPLKLFTISILWRMSVTNHPFYNRIKLPAQEEAQMRKMLLAGNPGAAWQYPCLVGTIVLRNGEPVNTIISNPNRIISRAGDTYYRFILDGLMFIYVVPSFPRHEFTPCALQPSGTWGLFRWNASDLAFLLAEVRQQAGLPP